MTRKERPVPHSARSRLVPLLAAAAIGLLSSPARADETGSRWIAAMPFGAGQIQNGDTGLGIFFAVGEALLGGATITTVALFDHLTSINPRPTGTGAYPSIAGINQELNTLVVVNRISFAGWAALTAAGIVEAEVSFGRRRAAPASDARPPVKATLSAVPGGGWLGVQGRF
jgi:hypothetical protein